MMMMMTVLGCIAVSSRAERAPVYGATKPNPKWARKPHKALRKNSEVPEMEVPVIYEAIRPQVPQIQNGLHVRAGDNKVIVHSDEIASYNHTGAYASKCCTICPSDDSCVGSHCYHKCHKVCGAACEIPMGINTDQCTLSVNCGLLAKAEASQAVVQTAVHTTQDMATGPEHQHARNTDDSTGTPDAPKKEWARYPHEATGPEEATGPSGPEEEEATGPSGPEEETEALEEEAEDNKCVKVCEDECECCCDQ